MIEATHSGSDSDSSVETAGSVPNPPSPETDAETPPADDREEQLPLDVTFEILKNRRRRLVLEYVRDTDDPTTIGELAEHIAAIENDTTVKQLNAQQRKRVYIGLYQCHLPKMDDAGVIEFNQDRGLITVGNNVEPLYEYLDVENDDAERPFGTTHAGGFVMFTSLFFVAQLTNATAVASGVVVAFLLAVLAVAYRANNHDQ